MFHKNNNNNKICKGNIHSNIFYVNIALVKINHNLSMKFLNRASDNKIGRDLIPRRN